MTERVPKKQNFRRHNTSFIGFMALLVFYTLPTLVAKAEAPGRTRSLAW